MGLYFFNLTVEISSKTSYIWESQYLWGGIYLLENLASKDFGAYVYPLLEEEVSKRWPNKGYRNINLVAFNKV